MGLLSRFKASPSSSLTQEKETQVPAPDILDRDPAEYDDTPYPLITWRVVVMGILVSMGGLIFGYDTGQISGFLEMNDFLMRFGTYGPNPKGPGETYQFSNVRSGLIVGLVSHYAFEIGHNC